MTFYNTDFYCSWEVFVAQRTPRNNISYIVLWSIIAILLVFSYFLLKAIYKYIVGNEKITETNVILNDMIMFDELTGVNTRRYFNSKVFDEAKRAIRYSQDLTFIFCDIDNFKQINDKLGHDFGDHVLSAVGNSLASDIRESDVVTRWGGEEFIIMLPHTNREDGFKVAEKMRSKLEMLNHSKVGKVTASFGVASLIPSEYIGSCISRADKAMYLAKAQGRNKTITSEPNDPNVYVNRKILWQKIWCCGIQVIDDEHKALLNEMTEIVELSYFKEKKRELSERIGYLSETLKQHFKDEEEILKKLNWDQLNEHAEIHNQLINLNRVVQNDLKTMEIDMDKALQVLLDAVFEHIIHEDYKYFSFVSDKLGDI
jgi:diguanylate cyclase (GGDEF)-like protein/hemerythrin-like metal-binding protein